MTGAFKVAHLQPFFTFILVPILITPELQRNLLNLIIPTRRKFLYPWLALFIYSTIKPMDHSQSTTLAVIWDGSVIILGAQRLEAERAFFLS